MSFGWNLVLALFALAPGFAAYAAIFLTPRVGPFRPSPPAPNSLTTVAVVTVAALVAHFLGAAALLLQAWACGRVRCIAAPFDPNLYTLVLPNGASRAAPEVAALALGGTLLLCLVSFGLAYFGLRLFRGRASLDRLLYGGYAELARTAQNPDSVVIAFVMTTVAEDGRSLGYEGIVRNLDVSSDMQIRSITLSDCRPFYLIRRSHAIERRVVDDEPPIPLLVIGAERIENVAFDVFEIAFEPDDEENPHAEV